MHLTFLLNQYNGGMNKIFKLNNPITGFSNGKGFKATEVGISEVMLTNEGSKCLQLTLLGEHWGEGNCSIVLPLSDLPKIIVNLINAMSIYERTQAVFELRKLYN